MPQELKQVNGRWVVTGDLRSSDLVPKPPAQRIKPVAVKPKPSKAKPRKPWWAKVLNDLQYEANQLRTDPLRSYQRALRNTIDIATGGAPRRELQLGAIGAGDNLQRLGYSTVQRLQGRKKADPSAGRFGELLDQRTERLYRELGAKPPSQMSPGERQYDQIRRSVTGNILLAPVTPGFGIARAATLTGKAVRGAAAFGVNETLATTIEDNTGGNPVNALNMIPGVNLPGAVNVGQDDPVDAFLKSIAPNAATSLALGGAVGGAAIGFRNIRRNIRAQRAVQREAQERAEQEAMGFLQKDDADGLTFTPQALEPPEPVVAPTPQRTPAEEFQQANAAMEERLGMRPAAEVEPAPAAAPEAPAPAAAAPDAPAPAPTRSLQEVLGYAPDPRVTGRPDPYSDVQNWLQQREAAADPQTAAYEQWLERNQQIRGVPSQQMEMGGPVRNPEQPLPEADPAINYWDYDPDLPESTALGRSISELSDQELLTVANNPGLPVVERVNQVIEARGAIDAPPPMSAQMVMAPTGRLADDYLERVSRALEAREDYQLRPLFDPEANPDLWRRAQAISGVDDPSQLSKADMLDTFRALQGEGQVPIANRLMGAQMMPTADIAAAPKVFQYKEGVDAQGQQIGNSLEGLERWDPAAEGIPQVWRDAAGEIGPAGQVYVVNGHNRLAAAQRMGIPSLRVEFLDAPTAAEARLQGAVANVSAGSGTVFDAAKLAREYGITDEAQLKALGKPGASGFWKDGMALGRLPEDVFTAAVNEQIPLRRAVIIGQSGVDEETMRSAYRYLVQQGPENVKEGQLREMLAMAQRSPAASSADQPDLLTGTEWGQQFNAGMLAKADLAAATRQLLSKEKKLFGTVGRQAGQIERVGQVDAGAAKEISGEASRALALFDQLKYEAGPVGDLLNEGTARVLAGEQAAAVAKGIKNRLAASIAEAMGKEVGPVTDVVQEDMFAAAGRAADAPEEPMAAPQQPVDLTPEERMATKAQLLHQATSGGEVRPPGTPMPELPEPAQVRLDEIDPDAPITPGSPAAQAVADEVRLAIEHKRMDAAMEWELEQAGRDGTNYHDLTFDQKQEIRNVVAGVPDVKIADLFEASARAMAQSDARLYRGIGEALGNIKQGVDELADVPGVPPAKEMPPANTAAGKAIRKKISDLEELIRFSRDVRLPAARERSNTEIIQSLEAGIPKWEKQLADLQAEYGIEPALAPAPVRPEPEVSGAAMPEDTRGSGRFFHGAAGDVRLTEGGEFGGDGMNIYGDGFYATDDLTTANKYQKKNARKGQGGITYEVIEKMPIKLFDLDKPASQEVLDLLRQNGGYDTMRELIDTAIDEAGGGASLAQVMDEMRGYSREFNIPAYEIQEAWHGFTLNLQEQGFGGFTHAGGKLAGRGKRIHQVRIYWDPANSIELRRVGDQSSGTAQLAPAPVRPEPLRLATPAQQPELLLPQDLSRSSPRYGRFTVAFESDLDRAAYELAKDAVRPSKAAPKFRQVIKEAGLDLDAVVAHGKRVKAALKQAAKGGDVGGQLELPAQPWRDGGDPPPPPPTQAAIQRTQRQIEANNQAMDDIRRKAQQEGC